MLLDCNGRGLFGLFYRFDRLLRERKWLLAEHNPLTIVDLGVSLAWVDSSTPHVLLVKQDLQLLHAFGAVDNPFVVVPDFNAAYLSVLGKVDIDFKVLVGSW